MDMEKRDISRESGSPVDRIIFTDVVKAYRKKLFIFVAKCAVKRRLADSSDMEALDATTKYLYIRELYG